jgi:hypothetical protein
MGNGRSSLIVVLDIDRTIFDTSRFLECLYEESVRIGADKVMIDQLHREEQQARGRSFDVVSRLVACNSLPSVKSMYSYGDRVLYDGVKELINHLRRDDVVTVLLTYGNSFAQQYKIDIIFNTLGFRLPYHITTEPNKAAWLERNETDMGFEIPTDENGSMLVGKSLVLIDDKEVNLQTQHPRLHTIFINNSSDAGAPLRGVPISGVWNVLKRSSWFEN